MNDRFDRQIGDAARRYAEGQFYLGLKSSERLERALAERACKNAAYEAHEERIQAIMSRQKRQMRLIKRSGSKLAILMCPPIIALFGLLSYLQFYYGDYGMAAIYAAGSLCFLVMLVIKLCFDR